MTKTVTLITKRFRVISAVQKDGKWAEMAHGKDLRILDTALMVWSAAMLKEILYLALAAEIINRIQTALII